MHLDTLASLGLALSYEQEINEAEKILRGVVDADTGSTGLRAIQERPLGHDVHTTLEGR